MPSEVNLYRNNVCYVSPAPFDIICVMFRNIETALLLHNKVLSRAYTFSAHETTTKTLAFHPHSYLQTLSILNFDFKIIHKVLF